MVQADARGAPVGAPAEGTGSGPESTEYRGCPSICKPRSGGVSQCVEGSLQEIKEAMVHRHLGLVTEAGDKGVQILPIYEKAQEGVYFKPGTLGFPVFQTACAEILFNPSATPEGKSRYLWELEQPSQAVANGVFIGANNRVGLEKPWEFGKFYGSSYFCDPRGKFLVKGSEDRDGWQFFRDRRPELYGEITQQLRWRGTGRGSSGYPGIAANNSSRRSSNP